MRNYEGMLVLDTRPAKKDWEALEKDLHAVFARHGAAIVRAARWGEKKMCYEIRRQKKGLYYLTYFQAPASAIAPLRRDLHLHDAVLRHLLLTVEKIPDSVTFYSEETERPAPPEGRAETRAPEGGGDEAVPEGGEGAQR